MAFFCFFKKEKKRKFSLAFIAFWQALGLVVYCSLVGLLFWQGSTWIEPISHSSLGPTLFLVLFVASAMICALLALGYPFLLFWEEKQTAKALKLVAYTAAWLALFVFSLMTVLLVS